MDHYDIDMNRTKGRAKPPRDEALETLSRWLDEARHTVFFGGAGVSTESGVPDYRSDGGIYAHEDRAEAMLTPRCLLYESGAFWRFYRRWFMPEGVLPNAAHRALARLEAEGRLDAVITQNVDGLHQAAGSREVIELHGSGLDFHCLDCQRAYKIDEVRGLDAVPVCECGGRIRPNIVLYEEGLDGAVMSAAVSAMRRADLVIIGGTSLTVWPVAGLLMEARPRSRVVLINRDDVASAVPVDLVIREPIGAFFADLMALRDAGAPAKD